MKNYCNEKKTVAIYTRVSTNDQVREGHSLEEQKRRLTKLCEANDYKIHDVYTDAGISGKSTENRPQYQKMMSDMRKGKFNLILAFKMDRISRDILDFEMFFREIKKYNCDVELLNDKIDTHSANGMMIARVLGAFCQFEREVIRERTLVGVESAVSKGHFGGRPPLGYKCEIINNNRTKKWIICESEANIVKEVFNLCLKGKTYFQISTILKEKYPNILAFYRFDKKTNKKKTIYRSWTDSSISVILNNKTYIGVYEHRKRVKDKAVVEILGKVEPIISEEIFNECQENIERNKRNYYREKTYLFMQKLKCPKCDRIMACNGTRKKSGKDYLYYKCRDCETYVREEDIEISLISKLNDLFVLGTSINDNYVAVDNDIANDFNKGQISHKIRFALDEKILSDKINIELNAIWNMTSYEARCRFIFEYIDCITIKKHISRKDKITKVEIVDLKIKQNKVQEMLELRENLLLDEVCCEEERKFSIANFKKETTALEYIEMLKSKYKIEVIDFNEDNDDYFYWDKSFFKIINVKSNRAIEKNRTMLLYLLD